MQGCGENRDFPLWLVAIVAALAGLGGCDSSQQSSPLPGSPIRHVVVIMQENRSFDNLFHGFPGADSAQSGQWTMGTVVPLTPVPLAEMYDLDHSHPGWWKAWDNGQMDGFAEAETNPSVSPYSYVSLSDIEPYWTLASQYTLADRMFQSNTGPSFRPLIST